MTSKLIDSELHFDYWYYNLINIYFDFFFFVLFRAEQKSGRRIFSWSGWWKWYSQMGGSDHWSTRYALVSETPYFFLDEIKDKNMWSNLTFFLLCRITVYQHRGTQHWIEYQYLLLALIKNILSLSRFLCVPRSEGGFFKAHLHFPKEYPLRPPRMKFVTEIWHPNIEKNGDVCISILHEPGDDKWGYEKASERWLPVHTVETILISVISMLADPNDESPANVDAAKEWRESYPEFKRKVARCVRKSQEDCS